MRSILTTVIIMLGVGAGIFLALCAFLYVSQDSLLFFRRPNDPALLQHWAPKRVEILSGDIVLHGWWADNADAATPAVILYFGGNAEDVLYTAATAHYLNARRVLVVNYRGYGITKGEPSQSALFQDALSIYDYAVSAGGVNPDDIVVMGRSLGSAVATMLTVERSVRRAILVTPYDSLVEVAARHYPLFPVRLLLRHPFLASDLARRSNAAAIIIAAGQDRIVPPVHARRLFDAWQGEKRLHILEGVGHNDIEQHSQYRELINQFLAARATIP